MSPLSLDQERTELANERTALAYVRTSVAFILLGAALMHFLGTDVIPMASGLLALALGVATFVYGALKFWQRRSNILTARL